MPSSPKKTPKTGSVLLGQELKRLRGGRTLKEIVALSKSPSLSQLVAPLSEAGLCEIESGKTMPLLATLHALSVIYKTSMSQLMAYVIEERIVASQAADCSDEGREAAFQRLLASRDWPSALVLCLQGERDSRTERERLTWRANRGSCLSGMGLHDEALALLTRCAESELLDEGRRFAILHNLSAAHYNAGNLRSAAMVAGEALAIAQRHDVPARAIATMQLNAAASIIDTELAAQASVDERRVREAQRMLDAAEHAWDPQDATGREWLQVLKARASAALGNLLVAERDLSASLARRAVGKDPLWAFACLTLATVRGRQSREAEVASLLEQAYAHAERASERDQMFEASFRLFLHYKEARPGLATVHLRRCSQLYPLVQSDTPWTRQFTAFQRSSS